MKEGPGPAEAGRHVGPAKAGRYVRYAIGAVLAAIALYASFRQVDHEAVRDAMHTASLSWTMAAVLSTLVSLTIVTWRSALLLDVPAAPNWGRLWNAVVIGQAVNIMFPLRFGEAARVGRLAGRSGWPVSRVALGVAVERFCDVGAFAAVVVLLAVFGRLPPALAGAVPTLLFSVLLTLVVIIAGIQLLPWVQRRILAPGPERPGLRGWLYAQTTAVSQGWAALMRGPRLLAVLLLTGLALISSVSTNYLVFLAFGLPVPAIAAFVLLVVLQLGTAVVSVPGNVGVFQYLTIVTLAGWHVPESTALAASLVLHTVSLGPRVALGAVAALSRR